MKWKQLLLIVAVSATSAVGSVWTYNKSHHRKNLLVSAVDYSKLPANYAGFSENVTACSRRPYRFYQGCQCGCSRCSTYQNKNPCQRE